MLSKYFSISSDDKLPNSLSNSDFNVNLINALPVTNVQNIYVESIQIPNNFYNIRDGTNGSQNNSLLITENGQPQVNVLVPQGQYLLNDFLTALDLAVNALMVGSVVTSTIDPVTKKLTMTFVGNTTILDASSPMAPVLGLATTTANQLVHVMDYITQLNGYQMVYLHSRDVASGNAIDAGRGYVSTVNSVSFHNVPFGSYGYKQINSEFLGHINYERPTSLTSINHVLRDNSGNKLDVGTGVVTIHYKVEY